MPNRPTVDLDRHLPAVLFALGAKISLHAQRENARALGLDMCEWRSLQILGIDGASSVNQIADRITMDRGGTSRAIARLEARGLIRRDAASDDRRKSVIALTDAGERLQAKVAAFANARAARLTARLSPAERADLLRMLAIVETEVDAMIASGWRPEEDPLR